MATELPPAYSTLSKTVTTDPNTEETLPSYGNDSETFGTSFQTKDSRIGFIQKVTLAFIIFVWIVWMATVQRKIVSKHLIPEPLWNVLIVLAIKLLQVMIVSTIEVGLIAVAGGFFNHRIMEFDGYIRINCLFVSTLVFAATTWSLHFCKKDRTVVPYNYSFLVAHPVTFAVFMYVVFYGLGIKSFMLSWLHFNGVVLVLLLYSILALQTDIEFKTNIGLYIAAGILIVAYPLTVPFTDLINVYKVFYFSLMMFLGAAYILYDIEAMTSKDYHTPLTPANFVKAAVLMHVDYSFFFKKLYNGVKEMQAENVVGEERVTLMTEVDEGDENR